MCVKRDPTNENTAVYNLFHFDWLNDDDRDAARTELLHLFQQLYRQNFSRVRSLETSKTQLN